MTIARKQEGETKMKCENCNVNEATEIVGLQHRVCDDCADIYVEHQISDFENKEKEV